MDEINFLTPQRHHLRPDVRLNLLSVSPEISIVSITRAGLWTTEAGINKVTFDMRGDYDAANMLFWNGESMLMIHSQ